MPEASQFTAAIRNVPWSTALRVAAAILLLGGLAGWAWSHGQSIAFEKPQIVGILIAQPFVILSIVMLSWRLKFLAGPPVRVRTAGEAICLSMVVFNILPSRLSEAAKPLYLHDASGLPLSRAFVVLVFERLLDLFCVCALILWVAGQGGLQGNEHLEHVQNAMVLLAVAGIVGLFVLLRFPDTILAIIRWLPFAWLRHVFSTVLGASRETAGVRRLGVALAISSGAWLLSYLTYLAYFHYAAPIPLSPSEVLLVFILGTLGISIAIAPGGLGTFEAAIALSLTVLGYEIGQGVATALALRVVTFLPATLAFFAMFLFGGRKVFQFMKRAGASGPRTGKETPTGVD